MKKLFVASVAATALWCAPALAADMPVKAPVYKAVDPGFSWTGCYAGVEGGGAWGRERVVATSAGAAGLPLTSGGISGGLVGGTVGCNYQTGSWVWGIEDDLSWTNFRGTHFAFPPFIAAASVKASANWLDTFRGRVGYAVDRSLWYVTGGIAYSDIHGLQMVPVPFISSEVTHIRAGWTVGGSVEWALADPHWSLKAEYLYIDFGHKNYDFNTPTAGALTAADIHVRENIVRVGLNYRFGH